MELNGVSISGEDKDKACKALLQVNPVMKEIREVDDLDDFLNGCHLPGRFDLTKGPELGDTEWVIAIYEPIDSAISCSHLSIDERTHYFSSSAAHEILSEIG